MASVIDRLPLLTTDPVIGPLIRDTSKWPSLPALAEFAKCYAAITNLPHFWPTATFDPSNHSTLLRALFDPATGTYPPNRCVHGANLHSQHAFAHAAFQHDFDLLLAGPSPAAPHHRARLRACTVPGATVPFATTAITELNSYTDLQTTFIYCNLLGLPHPFITSAPGCHPKCSRHTPEEAANPLTPQCHRLAYHHIACPAGGFLKARHDAVAAEIARILSVEAGYLCTLRQGLGSSQTSNKQVDIVAYAWWRSAKPLAVDVTVSNPMLPSYIAAAVTDAKAILRLREKEKTDKHGPGCKAMERDFAAAVYTTFGGAGGAKMIRTINSIFAESIAADKAAGGTGWAPAQRKLRVLESIAATLHRGSAAMASLLPMGVDMPQPPSRPRSGLAFRRAAHAFY